MDMLGNEPLFELDNSHWPIHPSGFEGPATKMLRANIQNSMIAEGCLIGKAKIKNSLLRSGVTVENAVSIEDSIIMDNVVLKKGCRLKRVIVDKLNVISEGVEIGFDPAKDTLTSRCRTRPSRLREARCPG